MKQYPNSCAGILYVENGIGKIRNKEGKVKSCKKIMDDFCKENIKKSLKNVKFRMKASKNFKEVWSDELIVIDYLQK